MGIELMNIRKKGLIIVFILSFLILPFFLSANDGKNQIIVNPQSLKFYAVIGATTTLSQVVSVFVSGNDSYKFESSSEWITVSAQSTDENNYILQVKINPRNLDIGIYEGAVKIAQNGAHNAKEIPVLLTIESKGSNGLSWLSIKTQSMQDPYTVTADGKILKANVPWEAFSYDSNNPTTVTITVHNFNYAEDQYEVALTLRARFDNDTGSGVDYKEVENSPILIRVMMNVWYIIPPC